MKTATTNAPDDSGLRRAFWSVGLCGVLFSVGSWFAFNDGRDALSVVVGAALALFNFWMTAYLVRGFLVPVGIRLPWPLIATLKLVVVLGGVYLLLEREVLSLLPLVLGFGALPVGIVFGQTRARAISADEELS